MAVDEGEATSAVVVEVLRIKLSPVLDPQCQKTVQRISDDDDRAHRHPRRQHRPQAGPLRRIGWAAIVGLGVVPDHQPLPLSKRVAEDQPQFGLEQRHHQVLADAAVAAPQRQGAVGRRQRKLLRL